MATKKTGRSKTSAKRVSTRAAAKPARSKSAPGKTTSLRGATPSFTVNDIERSLAWYRDVLGFAVKERWEDAGKLLGVEVAAGDVSFMLGQDDWKKGRNRVKGEGVRIYCTTGQDVDRLAEGIKTRGGTLLQEPADQPWGTRSFAVEDPDGFKITIASESKR
jgi:lactoylglutathione lyase